MIFKLCFKMLKSAREKNKELKKRIEFLENEVDSLNHYIIQQINYQKELQGRIKELEN